MIPRLAASAYRGLQFRSRQAFFGKLKLRRGKPAPERNAGEIAFYSKIVDVFARDQSQLPPFVIDVGCRNWSYVPALRTAFPDAQILGFEVDAGRRYLNLFRRRDQMESNALASGARALAIDFATWESPGPLPASSLATVFFPFVFDDPCVAWGLPTRFVCFDSIVRNAKRLGMAAVLSAHQGSDEAEQARGILESVGQVLRSERLDTDATRALWPSKHATHVFVTRLD